MFSEFSRQPGLLENFLERLGHPLGWSRADKCLLATGVVVPLFAASYALNWYVALHPERMPYYNHPFLPLYLRWHELVIGGWLLIGAAGLYLRTRSPDNLVFAYLTSQFGCITTAIFMYFPGYFTTPYLMGILGGGVMLLMFFEMRQAVWGLATMIAVYLGLSLAIAADLLPGAPLLAYPPYEDGRLALWWTAVNTGLCLVLMVLIFGITGFAIHQWRDREAKLDALSRTDSLTQLANRHHFLEMFGNEVARALRLGRPLSLVLCDADRFKEINDTYGHQTGDEVLRRIAHVLRDCCRTGIDTVGRIGGDEFAIVLAETDLPGARTLASRVAQALRKEVFDRQAAKFSTSLSIGVAVRKDEPFDADALMEAADMLLYRAKKDGRDRVVAAGLSDFLPRPAL